MVAKSGTLHRDPDATTGAAGKSRLIVELIPRSASDLAWAVEEEGLNKTTIVNRAIQVYKRVMEAQANGGSITIVPHEGSEPETIVFV